ncbi:2'-5' RNA ligase family protein [Pelagibius sp.]|uniref:2'-5' RNA ligase family protein n=1 Tax=Pelagibius sp. TaxID=1931238 RepID=UPI003B502A47
MTNFIVCYPQLNERNRQWIDGVRRNNDPQAEAIAPHVTLVFGFTEVARQSLEEHLRKRAAAQAPIAATFSALECRKGVREEAYYAYLMPERGRVALTALYDQLHRGVLADEKIGAPVYVPHITLARSRSRAAIETLVASLALPERGIAAVLPALTWVAADGGAIRDLAVFPFAGKAKTPHR